MRSISEFPTPQNVDELRRFLGMVDYMSKFLPHATDVIHPLHNLLKKDVPWNWSSSQAKVFQQVKSLIVDSPTLSFYDPNKELTLENDASELWTRLHTHVRRKAHWFCKQSIEQ